jgi:hypothetical protein
MCSAFVNNQEPSVKIALIRINVSVLGFFFGVKVVGEFENL